MSSPGNSCDRLTLLEERLGYTFKDRGLLTLALTHSSVRQHGLRCNERLEFLGDAVLGFLVSTYLYDAFTAADEGDLTTKRARAVSRKTLVAVANELELERWLTVAKGVEGTRGLPPNLAGNAMEALIGAVFLDGGTDAAWALVMRHFFPWLHRAHHRAGGSENPKSALQMVVQRLLGSAPVYRTIEVAGPPHQRTFTVAVEVPDRELSRAEGLSRKEAEIKAAIAALEVLAEEDDES